MLPMQLVGDFLIVMIDIWVAIIISLVAAVLWTLAYGISLDTQIKGAITSYNISTTNTPTIKYGTGTCTHTAENGGQANIENHNDKGPTLTITNMEPDTAAPLENITGTQTPATVKVDPGTNKLTIKYNGKCIEITLTGSDTIKKESTTVQYGHIFTEGFDPSKVHPAIISPTLMVIVGMGLLVMTIFQPMIVAALRKYKPDYSPTYFEFPAFRKWYDYPAGQFYLGLNILMVIKITLAAVFIYSLNYRDSVDLSIQYGSWRRQ